ncbi:MAG TPA: hypothetical protein VLF67_00230 [Candidatus Saccharimonas sp.]|nr:hypothetical protein [Candidatus Saccharimonas sp.]
MMVRWLAAWLLVMMAALPASGSYKLNSYGFGNGGTADSSSSHYRVNGAAGEVAGDETSTNYKVGAGETREKQANVPNVTIANGARWYNKLLVTISTNGNPTDALYAVAISTDSFVTTQYVQSDFTVGSSFAKANFLSYAAWGSGSGQLVRGLTPGTTYTVKATAYRGVFTQSPFGPTSSASTNNPELSFDIDVAATDISTSPPYQIDFGNLTPGSVTDSPTRVWISYDTNAESGGGVYLTGQNAGLKSANTGYTIASVSNNLTSLAEGSGVQGASATQASGGPLALVAPYDGSGQNVGIADGTIRQIFSDGAPITSGRGSFILKAKTQTSTPAANDYTEILTAIAAGSF